jgi:uncharacterized membrane protein
MKHWVQGEGKAALEAAVGELEKASGVEVVLAVRERARFWLVQHVLVGIAAGIGALVFCVWRFLPRWEIVVLPVAAGVIGTALVELVGPLYRFLAPGELRDAHVREAARAAFLDNKVHTTTARTGLLVFVAVREQRVELIGDTGISGVPLHDWSRKLAAAVGDGPAAVAKILATFAPQLATAAPRRAGDVNELADAPREA